MCNYKNSKIYALYINSQLVYIGSTVQSLVKRLSRHREDYVKKPNRLVYKTIKEMGGFDYVEIVLLETYPCDNKSRLRVQERRWYDILQPTGNQQRPIVTYEEQLKNNRKYSETNAERISEQKHEYYVQNRETILQQKREYRARKKSQQTQTEP